MELIETIEQLEERLSRPTEGALATLRALDGDVLVLGAGGKMGPTLARMVRRGVEALSQKRRVLAVSRFSSPAVAAELRGTAWRRFPATSRIATRFALCPTRRTSSSWPDRNSARKTRRADVGDEYARARRGGGALRPVAHRGVLDRLRLCAVVRERRWFARG